MDERRSRALRILFPLGVFLVVLATTAPCFGVTRCWDGATSGGCESTWYTAVGAEAWPVWVAVLAAVTAAIMTRIAIGAVLREVHSRASAD